MSVTLRDYQEEAIQALFAGTSSRTSQIVIMATGCGKTVVASDFMKRWTIPGDILFIAHRRELLDQTVKTYERLTGEQAYLEMGDCKAPDLPMWGTRRVVVGSVQSLRNRLHLPRFDPKRFSLVVVDECHHGTASSYLKVLEHFGILKRIDAPEGEKNFIITPAEQAHCRCVGLTATAKRTDEEALDQIFGDEPTFEMNIWEAIQKGWLVNIEQKAVEVKDLDLDSVKCKRNDAGEMDFAPGQLEALMSEEGTLHEVADTTLREIGDRQAIVFAAGVAHAQLLEEVMNRRRDGVARAIYGSMDEVERKKRTDAFKSGALQVLVNVMIACLDEETEILTSDGWVGMNDISYDHKIANWKDGNIFFDHPLGIEIRDRREDERMVVLETKNISIRVTDNHRMLYRTWPVGRFIESRAHEIINKQCRLPICGNADPFAFDAPKPKTTIANHKRRIVANSFALRKNNGYGFNESIAVATERIAQRNSLAHASPGELSIDECMFIGFWLGDGSSNKLQSGGIEYKMYQGISLDKLVAWFDGLVERLGYDVRRRINYQASTFGPTKTANMISWSFGRGTGFGNQERHGLFRIEPYLKKSGSELLWGLNHYQFLALIQGFWMADGQHRNSSKPRSDNFYIDNSNRELLDLLQCIGVCRGFRSTIRTNYSNMTRYENAKPMHRLSISKRDDHDMTKYRLQFETEPFKEEKVWCVKSHSSFIVTRRRGSVVITGNTEGFDHPETACVVMARPTKSLLVYTQCLGRGTRPGKGVVDGLLTADERRAAIEASNKPNVLVLDFVGNSTKHKLVTAVDVLGGEHSVALRERANEMLKAAGGGDVEEAIEQATASMVSEIQREARKKFVPKSVYELFEISPFEAGASGALKTVETSAGGATDKQIAALGKLGVRRDVALKYGKKQAGAILESLRQQRCTYGQAQALKRFGRNPSEFNYYQAMAALDTLFSQRKAVVG